MTSSCFVTMLGDYLAKFRETAELLAEARQLGQPAEATEGQLLQHLLAYTWAVRSRALLAPAATPAQQATELHTRLSIVEALVALRHGPLPLWPAEPAKQTPATPALWQRLVAAESRLFHLYGVAPLN